MDSTLLSKINYEAGKLRGTLEYLKEIEQIDMNSYQKLLERVDAIDDVIGKINRSEYSIK
jgi:hypothetical protein